MRPPRRRASRRRAGLAALTEHVIRLLDLLEQLDDLDDEEELDDLDMDEQLIMQPGIKRRKTLLVRKRRTWADYTRPMLGDETFPERFRMEHADFMVLVELLRPSLQRDARMGALRNGAISVEYPLGVTLRWLAGAAIWEGVDGHVMAKSTTYAIVHRVIAALCACPQLACKWPEGEDALRSARSFRKRSENDVIRRAVGAMDGLFVRLMKPIKRDHGASHSFFSGHKKGHGMNLQVCKRGPPLCVALFNVPMI